LAADLLPGIGLPVGKRITSCRTTEPVRSSSVAIWSTASMFRPVLPPVAAVSPEVSAIAVPDVAGVYV
jgi:hypothetical protein